MNYWTDKQILVTGGGGFLGTHLVKKLILEKKVEKEQIFIPTSKENDLRVMQNCMEAVRDKDIVIHLAANVGGIGYNRLFPGSLFYDNALMGIQLLEAARKEDVHKIVLIGTVCSYPKYTPIPFKEDDLWLGYPEETNAPYGIAKKGLLVQSQAYREQYGLNSIFLIPVNLYGPGDNFHPEYSHVIPALIRKISEAKKDKRKVIAWGTGEASREFLYVEDAAEGILLGAELYDKPDPVNLGTNEEIKIRDLVKLISELSGYSGEIVWDHTKPDGQPRRKLNIERARNEFGFLSKTSLKDGLLRTIKWYAREYNSI